jgi:hypothetical protein
MHIPLPAGEGQRRPGWPLTLHECEHHLQDFDRVMRQVAEISPSP